MVKLITTPAAFFLLLVVAANCTSGSQEGDKDKEEQSFADVVNTIEPLPGIKDSDDWKQLEHGIDSLYDAMLTDGANHNRDLATHINYSKQHYRKLFEENAFPVQELFDGGTGGGEAGRGYYCYLLRKHYLDMLSLQRELSRHFDELDSAQFDH